MRGAKSSSRSKKDATLANGVSDGDKGVSLSGIRNNTSGSDSDDDDVMRQLLPPDNRTRATAHGKAVASRALDVGAGGPASDSDDRVSAVSEDEIRTQRDRKHPRSGRGVGTSSNSPATTPVGSPSQTPGPNTSSSEGVPPSSDRMDVDNDGAGNARRAPEERTGRRAEGQANGKHEPAADGQQTSSSPVPYIACHTWPPCGVCAAIAGIPTATLAAARRQKPPPFFPETVSTEPFRYGPATATHSAFSPVPEPRLPRSETTPRPTNAASRPANEVRPANAPRSPDVSRAANPAQTPNGPPSTLAPPYPMEPLFVSAGVAMRQTTFKTLTPAHMAARGMPPSSMINPLGRQTTLASVTAPVGVGPYSRVPQQRNAQASSSAVRVEDMEETEGGRIPGLTSKFRGKGKFRAARHSGRKQRAKRYNRKKREEWPPEGWNPIWEEERPRNWGDYHIPDEVATDRVYDHLKKRFDLKSAGVCNWEGCKPANPEDPSYKMLKRHVETVHLGLKLVCKLCGVRKRADNRRKATHKRGCPEREEDVAKAKGAGASKAKTAAGETRQDGGIEADEGSAEEDGAEDEEGDEEDELEEDELEEDELEDDAGAEGGDGPGDHHMDSEFESEDD